LVRLLYLLPTAIRMGRGEEVYLGGDWGLFIALAEGILSGSGMILEGRPTAEYPPLYPLFVAGVYWIAGPRPLALLSAQALIGALACPLIASMGRALSGPGAAALAGLLYALYPPFLQAEHLIMTEALFTFWVILTLYALLRLTRDVGPAAMALFGAASALGSLTKPSLALFPIVALLGLIVGGCRQFLRLAARGLIFALVFTALLTPWVLRNYRAFGEFVPLGTEAGAVFYDGLLLREGWKPGFRRSDEVTARAAQIDSEPERSRFLFRAGWAEIRERPRTIPALLLYKALFFFSPFDWEIFQGGTYSFAFVFLLPYALFGLILGRGQGAPRWPVWGLMVYFFLLGLVFIGTPRLRLPSEAGVMLLGAIGLSESFSGRRGRAMGLAGGWLLVNLFFFFMSDLARAWLRGLFILN
jgi:4-amino-4-deoxy-L-arabinose transferase-like glycosyltransferase